MVNAGFNRSLLVDWWSIGRLKKKMVDVRILSISYPFYWTINRLKIVSNKIIQALNDLKCASCLAISLKNV